MVNAYKNKHNFNCIVCMATILSFLTTPVVNVSLNNILKSISNFWKYLQATVLESR